jgi:outer membrane protein
VSNLESDLKSIDATRIARELAEENVRNQQARYNVGLATTENLLDFQDRLTQARFAEVQALTAYNTDLAEMRRVEGTLLSARNVLIERVSPEATLWWASF